MSYYLATRVRGRDDDYYRQTIYKFRYKKEALAAGKILERRHIQDQGEYSILSDAQFREFKKDYTVLPQRGDERTMSGTPHDWRWRRHHYWVMAQDWQMERATTKPL